MQRDFHWGIDFFRDVDGFDHTIWFGVFIISLEDRCEIFAAVIDENGLEKINIVPKRSKMSELPYELYKNDQNQKSKNVKNF
uniref:Uncharacterized protein n=1 Tax=Onchocerca volvulus TaxID=6282 RepID=A0A8R1Y3Q8_ONCVO